MEKMVSKAQRSTSGEDRRRDLDYGILKMRVSDPTGRDRSGDQDGGFTQDDQV